MYFDFSRDVAVYALTLRSPYGHEPDCRQAGLTSSISRKRTQKET
ncbi:hypothetical protein [uncultured Dokdonia sp.]|nr:hypothetical protein [uncultured Dokdonia sp.]